MEVNLEFGGSGDSMLLFKEMENYFEFYKVSTVKRVKVLYNALTGKTREWVQVTLPPPLLDYLC